jgi:3-mercaptopyruvate sulfurtransferase SseA
MMKIQEASLRKTNKRPLWPLLLIGAGVIVLIAALASILLNSGEDSTSNAANSGQEIPFSQIARVDVATAKNASDSGGAVIVDVRDEVYFNDGHIPGAISIPLNELESRVGELDPADWIILYCT